MKSLYEVKNQMGADTAALHYMGHSSLLNIYSPNKPYNRTLNGDQISGFIHSLYRDSETKLLMYNQPSEIRLGDFTNYDQYAEPSTVVENLVIYEGNEDIYDPLGCTLYAGINYQAEFTVRRGTSSINPSTINTHTNWSKPGGDGYGGIIAKSYRHPELDGRTSDVYDITTDGVNFSINFSFIYDENQKRPFLIEYAVRSSGVWSNSGYPVEHDRLSLHPPDSQFKNWYEGITLQPFLFALGNKSSGRRDSGSANNPYIACDFINSFTDRSLPLYFSCENLQYYDIFTGQIYNADYMIINGGSGMIEPEYQDVYELGAGETVHVQFLWTQFDLPTRIVYPWKFTIYAMNYYNGAVYASYEYVNEYLSSYNGDFSQ